MPAGSGNALVVNEHGEVTTDHVEPEATDASVEASALVEGDVVAQPDAEAAEPAEPAVEGQAPAQGS